MKKLLCILLGTVLFSCNPYEQYIVTHYYVQAEIDPSTSSISANVQIVFVARKEYHDSICFFLNPGVEIHSLAAQELEHYVFQETGTGELVLYTEDPVFPGDQLHISLSYSGLLGNQEIHHLDSSLLWYPVNEDTQPCTYQAKFALPGSWQINDPEVSFGKHGKWLLQARKPRDAFKIEFTRE